MLFEIRASTPAVSAPWQDARDMFLNGQTRRAVELVEQMRGADCMSCANDVILNIELARACGDTKAYLALARIARQRFPGDPYVQLYFARSLERRGRHLAATTYLHKRKDAFNTKYQELWLTQLASIYASASFEATCKKLLKLAAPGGKAKGPLSLYNQSTAYESLQQWGRAIGLARSAVAAAPDWSRARAYLAHCLLSRGLTLEARRQFKEAELRGHEDSFVDISAAMLTLSLGKAEEACSRLARVLENWPRADFQLWARRMLVISLVELGRYQDAKKFLAGYEDQIAIPSLPAKPRGAHQLIPVPLIAQNKNQCLPTAIQIAAWPQGHRFDADTLFKEMRGSSGTAVWRARNWVEQRGMHFIPIRLEKEAIVELLDLKVPVFGAFEGLFNAHVDVVCGYNNDLDALYVRDPASWALAAWPWSIALAKYAPSHGLIAVIDKENVKALEAARRWLNDQSLALVDLAEAVALGKRTAAEKAFSRVPDDSPAVQLRDAFAVGMVISPQRYAQSMTAIARNESISPIPRARALMTLALDDIELALADVVQTLDNPRLSRYLSRYLRLRKSMSDGRWGEASRLIDQFLITGASVSIFWDMKGDILAELGDHEQSRKMLKRAIELDPYRLHLREKLLNRSATQLKFSEYLTEINAILADDPDDKRLLFVRDSVLLSGPDGKAYESSALQTLKWFPRDPQAYRGLLNWYYFQEHAGRFGKLLDRYKRMLPELFEPDVPTERAAEPLGETSSELTSMVTDQRQALPDDHDELLTLAWNRADPNSELAVQKLSELEREGRLLWYQRASFVSCRLAHTDASQFKAQDISALLPEQAAGPPHWFVLAVCQPLTESKVPWQIAKPLDSWLLRLVPGYEQYPNLWLQHVMLLELAGDYQTATTELEKLLQRHPALSAALYRMAVIKYRQQIQSESLQLLEKALEVNPGMTDATLLLRGIHWQQGNNLAALECTRALRKQYPYSVEYLYDEAFALLNQRSLAEATEVANTAVGDFSVPRIQVLRANLEVSAGLLEKAAARLKATRKSSREDDPKFEEEYFRARLSLAIAYEDTARILNLCRDGLQKWPHFTKLKEVQSEWIGKTDRQQAHALLRDVLLEGAPDVDTAIQYLSTAKRSPVTVACKLLSNCSQQQREVLIPLFAKAFERRSDPLHRIKYLAWAIKRTSNADLLRYQLASQYDLQNQQRQAIRIAKESYNRNKADIDAIYMLGRCLIGKYPKKALPYLEAACKQNQSAHFLLDLARCYHMLGNKKQATTIYRELLERSPHSVSAGVSWVNLVDLGVPVAQLWDYVHPLLENGKGVHEPYLLVGAMLAARKLRQQVPAVWYPLARQRWAELLHFPPVANEQALLRYSLYAWTWKRPQDGESFPRAFRFPVATWLTGNIWPGTAWIPDE